MTMQNELKIYPINILRDALHINMALVDKAMSWADVEEYLSSVSIATLRDVHSQAVSPSQLNRMKMKDILAGNTMKQISEALDINDILVSNGKTFTDLKEYKESVKTLKDMPIPKKKVISSRPQKRCPACSRTMRLVPMLGHDRYKSKWVCGSGCGSCNHGGGCEYTEFNEISIEDIIKQGEPK